MERKISSRRRSANEKSLPNTNNITSAIFPSLGQGFNQPPSAKPSLITRYQPGSEPCHKDNPQNDIPRQLRVYSRRERKWREVKAIFVDDLDENWISDDLVQILDLNRTPIEGTCEYGCRNMKTFRFNGRVELQWTSHAGPPSSKYSTCRIVPCKLFDIYFRKGLLSSIKNSGLAQSPITQSPPISPTMTVSLPVKSGLRPLPPEQVAGAFDGVDKELDDNSHCSRLADEWMGLLKNSVHKSIHKRPGFLRGPDISPVKLAVLDTGVDLEHNFIDGARESKRIKACRNFVTDDGKMTDSSGHGTHVAHLLMEVAPDAQIFIAKIAETEEIPKTHKIAEAITWAIDNDVNIITMSFGLDSEDPEVQKAIVAAYSKGILMFAAASNKGGNFAVTYPATSLEVMCIFSTDGRGNSSEFNPTQKRDSKQHFATLGEGIKSAWLTTPEDSSPCRRMSGTSFATPIVAGLAACILEFALINDVKEKYNALYNKLRTLKGMQAVFYEHLVDERSNIHYIHPWKLFSKERSKQDVLHILMDLLKRH